MKLLSLDLSTKQSGYCIGEDGIMKTYGYISASSSNVIARIIKMRNEIAKLIQQHKVNKIIIQQVRPEYNSHTNKVLMWLQAAVIIGAYQANPKIEYEFIGTSTWRAALKIKQGRGVKRDSAKNFDIQYVKNKYNITVNDDTADAICIFDAYWQKNDNEINWE